jgi:hypothetical protein
MSLLFLLFSSKRTSRLRDKKTTGQLMLSKKGKVPQKFMPKKSTAYLSRSCCSPVKRYFKQ